MSVDRLERLVGELARAQPVLDDLTRARVAAQLEAARNAPAPAQPAPGGRRLLGGALAAVLAISAGVALRARDGHAPVAPPGELANGRLLATGRGASVHGGVAGAAVTLIGPAWAMRDDRRIVVDAETLVVERAGGGAPVEVVVRTATIRVQNAKFLVESAALVRVSVSRGEVVLRCPGGGERPVRAPEQATCDPASRSAPPVLVAAAPPRVITPIAVERAPADIPPPRYSQVLRAPAPAPRPPAMAMAAPPPAAMTAAARERERRYVEVLEREGPRPIMDLMPASRPAPRPIDPRQPYGAATDAPRDSERALGPGATPGFGAAATTLRALKTQPVAPPTASPLLADGSSSRLATSLRPLPDHLAVAPAAAQDGATSVTAERYAAAERLMAQNPAAARAALDALVADEPEAPEVPNALFDSAKLAVRLHDVAGAQATLDRLDKHPHGHNLAIPASYLRCSLIREGADKLACYARVHAAYPDSASDADVLARLASGYVAAGDCKRAMPLLAEYARRYSDKQDAATLASMMKTCDDAP